MQWDVGISWEDLLDMPPPASRHLPPLRATPCLNSSTHPPFSISWRYQRHFHSRLYHIPHACARWTSWRAHNISILYRDTAGSWTTRTMTGRITRQPGQTDITPFISPYERYLGCAENNTTSRRDWAHRLCGTSRRKRTHLYKHTSGRPGSRRRIWTVLALFCAVYRPFDGIRIRL